MELTYQSPLMPASYTALSADEMTYIDGGAIQIGSYLIEFHPEALLQSVVNFTVNFGQLMGKAALGTAVGGLILMHKDGLTLSQSVSYYWDGQSKAGKVGTVVVGGQLPLWRSALSLAGTAQCRLSRSITRSSPSSSSSRMLTRRPRQILPRPSSRMPASPTPSWLQLPESV